VAGLAATAAPASASEIGFTHPAAICIEERADADFGGPALDEVLSAADLAEAPSEPTAVLLAIAEECVATHGVPDIEGGLVGGLVTAKVMRDEALRRIEVGGVDRAWVAAALSRVRSESGGDLGKASNGVIALIGQEPPTGLSIDVETATGDDLLLGVLILTHVTSALQVDQLREQLER
jgi:hypothetical protein